MSVRLINPATEKKIAEYKMDSSVRLRRVLHEAHSSQPDWGRQALSLRIPKILELAERIGSRREELAKQITLEMGKPIRQAFSEVDKSVSSIQTICEQMPRWLAQRETCLPSGYGVRLCPLGVTLGIMPWNFPVWQVIRFAIPSLVSGNTVLIKHAPNTFGVAQLLSEIFNQVLPSGIYSNLRVSVTEVAKLIKDPRVRGVSLTGSMQAGAKVGALAGLHLKKCVLELGGSDAYVVLDDADVNRASEICVRSRLQNAGQSCVAAKRFIVTKKNVKSFTESVRVHLQAVAFGDPLDADTQLGPMARQDLRESLHRQVQASVRKGAKVALGGQKPKSKGFFYPASLLLNVKPGQEAFDQELFGPVATIIEAKDEAEALRLANLSRYGLGGAIFSKDVERAYQLAVQDMDCGMVFVNEMVKSDAQIPFGGVKDSGIGRELGSEGVFEFTNIKTIFKP